MPLNHKDGENIEGLGVGAVVPIAKWADTRFFDMAAGMASNAFKRKGSLDADQFDQAEVLVMEYPNADKLAFVFCKNIARKEHLFPWVFTLEPPVVAELVNAGKWTRLN